MPNKLGTWALSTTIISSGMGAWILFSPAEAGSDPYFGGLVAIVGYAIGSAGPYLAFMKIGPRIREAIPNGTSITDYVWQRYGKITYLFILIVSLSYMFIFLSAELTGISLAINLIAKVPLALTATLVGVATITYTTYGGLKASVFTDIVQSQFLFPILILILFVIILTIGSPIDFIEKIQLNNPQLINIAHRPGIEFAISVIIAITSANIFHQGYWQRIYSAKNNSTLTHSMAYASVLVIPIILITGFFGIISVGLLNERPDASIAMFALAAAHLDEWALILVLILGLALAMSSMDTLLNGLVSIFTADLARIYPDFKETPLLNSSRALTIIVALPTIFIASKGYGVLYMFLMADLIATAAVFPIFWGLYSKRYPGNMAILSSVIGIVAGLTFFPTSLSFENTVIPYWNSDGNLMWAFLLALCTSTALTLATSIALTISSKQNKK